MSKQAELLDRFYYSFINLDNPKDFFYGLRDYIDFIEGVPELKKITDELSDQSKPLEERLKRLDKVAVEKMEEIHKELLSYITENKISKPAIDEALKEYDAWLGGKVVGSNSLPDSLHDQLSDVVNFLYQLPEHKDFASRYVIFSKDKTYIKHYLFPKEISDYFETLTELKEKYKTELWGQMSEVNRLYQIIKRGGERRKELVKSAIEENSLKASYELFANHDIILGEWRRIETERFDDIVIFDTKRIRPIITRFQNYLLREVSEPSQPIELFTNNVIPDRSMEIQKQMEESQRWIAERAQKDKQHRELMKQNRILATKTDKYTHALDLIIEQAEFNGNGSSFNIDYYDFNFEDRMDASKMLEKFLTELQGKGCFEQYGRTNYSGGTKFGFIKVDIEKLKKLRGNAEEPTTIRTEVAPHTLAQGKVIKNMVDQNEMEDRIVARLENKTAIIPEKSKIKCLKQKELITKITLIEMNDGKRLIAINDNFNETKQIKNTEWWEIFVREIKERGMINRTNQKEIPKGMFDYFNYNKEKCPIYMGGKYNLTDIFVGRGIDTAINSEVKTKVMTERQYLTRRGRKK